MLRISNNNIWASNNNNLRAPDNNNFRDYTTKHILLNNNSTNNNFYNTATCTNYNNFFIRIFM